MRRWQCSREEVAMLPRGGGSAPVRKRRCSHEEVNEDLEIPRARRKRGWQMQQTDSLFKQSKGRAVLLLPHSHPHSHRVTCEPELTHRSVHTQSEKRQGSGGAFALGALTA